MAKSRLRVAVVDDEEPVRKALRRLFHSAQFDVEVFAAGQDFLNSLRRRLPDCVVLDLHLPGLTGLEVLQRLRQEGSRLPVLVITGKDEAGSMQAAFAAGAADYLVKPLDGQTLLAAVDAAVRRARGPGGPRKNPSSGSVPNGLAP